MSEKFDFAAAMRENREMSLKDKLSIVGRLSLPGILAQISEIIMQYIDAAMVGVLGAGASAAIGLVASSTWLFGGVLMATASGFSVQVAHAVGAGDGDRSRSIFKQSLLTALLMSAVTGMLGALLALKLPMWLGAEEALWKDATSYFMAYALFIPARQLNSLGLSMVQCTGNMKTPSILSALMCVFDVVFNFFLIFPTRMISIFGMNLTVPGAGLGVLGAQLGTSLAIAVCMLMILRHAIFKAPMLKLKGSKGGWLPEKTVLKEAVDIGVPMALGQCATTGAQVISTRIVAPLGTVAIAANSFAVTAESLCYMPGYGIGAAATTMVGQAIGAKRKDLAESFAWLTTLTGMAIMTLTGFAMWFFCPYVFMFLTPVEEVRLLGASVLRIELLAEPLFAASIVVTGALRGAGDTLVPNIINLLSIWCIRIVIAWLLASRVGLRGVWIAMAADLSVRGILLLIRLKRGTWQKYLNMQ